ncbi:MAG: L,D-transpeptidase family protein, partial [Victivallales bacterium]|nr:L,D-transpeptidase family protein [Victivallales bacterium]
HNNDLSVPPAKAAKLKGKLAEIKNFLRKEDYVNAAALASSIITSKISEDTEIWKKAAEALSEANTKIFMSDIPSPRKKRYTIKSGDNLISIANSFGTTVEAIQKSNSLSPSNSVIFPGKTLYIYAGEWTVKASRSRFSLYLYDKGKLFKIYKIGVGRQGRTPLGHFVIQNKQKEPVWYNNGRSIPYGDKGNVLGTRWMALRPVGETNKNLSGYGIHGTWQPETVGTNCSNGCVRMRNEDVNELFTILPYHTKVTIEE